MFSSQHVRPIHLLNSDLSSEDETMAPTRKRLSYTELVNTQEPTRHHVLVLVTLCSIIFSQSLQLYLPLLTRSEYTDRSDMTLVVIAFPLASFLSPLIDALLTRFSLKRRIFGMLASSLIFLLLSLLCKGSSHLPVVLRCLAGVLVVPQSILTQLWTHIFPQSLHLTCRLIVSCTSAASLALTVFLLIFGDEAQINYNIIPVVSVIVITIITYTVSIILTLFITESPLMQLNNGKYSLIMTSIKKAFKGPHVDSLKLQEIDFSDDSASGLWNPVYLFNEQRNSRNVLILGLFKFARGYVMATILCGLLLLSGEKCSERDSSFSNPRSVVEYVLMGCCSLLGTYLVPIIHLKHQVFISSATSALSLALLAGCVFSSRGPTVLLCLILSSHTSFSSCLFHLASTVSLSIAGECLTGLVHTAGLILGKLSCDISIISAFIASAVLYSIVFVIASFITLPSCKDVISNDNMLVEMDDPIVETIEMEESHSQEGVPASSSDENWRSNTKKYHWAISLKSIRSIADMTDNWLL